MSMIFTGNSLRFLQLLELKVQKSPPSPRCQIAIWDELSGIIPPLRLSYYTPDTTEWSIKEQIALYRLRGILRIQCAWDKVNFFLGCGDHFSPARLEVFQLIWKKEPIGSMPADLEELLHYRIQLLADACFNPLLRISGVRDYLLRKLEALKGDGARNFIRELMLTLCSTQLTRDEKFDYDHFAKRARNYAYQIAVNRARYQASESHRDLAGRCTQLGVAEIDDTIYELCSMIWAYLANADTMLPQTESLPQHYAFKETFNSRGGISISPVVPVAEHRCSDVSFHLRSDQYFEVFSSLAAAECAWSAASDEIKKLSTKGGRQ